MHSQRPPNIGFVVNDAMYAMYCKYPKITPRPGRKKREIIIKKFPLNYSNMNSFDRLKTELFFSAHVDKN